MELPKTFFEPDYLEADHEYIHINDHELELSDIEQDLIQLVDELYDDCENIDRDIVHNLMCDLCKKLHMEKPNLKKLKL